MDIYKFERLLKGNKEHGIPCSFVVFHSVPAILSSILDEIRFPKDRKRRRAMMYMAMGLKPYMTMDDFDVYARIKCSLVNGTERAIVDDNWDDIERYIRRNSETNDIYRMQSSDTFALYGGGGIPQ